LLIHLAIALRTPIVIPSLGEGEAERARNISNVPLPTCATGTLVSGVTLRAAREAAVVWGPVDLLTVAKSSALCLALSSRDATPTPSAIAVCVERPSGAAGA